MTNGIKPQKQAAPAVKAVKLKPKAAPKSGSSVENLMFSKFQKAYPASEDGKDISRFKLNIFKKYGSLVEPLRAKGYTNSEIAEILVSLEGKARVLYHGLSQKLMVNQNLNQFRGWLISEVNETLKEDPKCGERSKFADSDGKMTKNAHENLMDNITSITRRDFNDLCQADVGFFKRVIGYYEEFEATSIGWKHFIADSEGDNSPGINTFMKRIDESYVIGEAQGVGVQELLESEHVIMVPKEEFANRVVGFMYENVCARIDNDESLTDTQRTEHKEKALKYLREANFHKLLGSPERDRKPTSYVYYDTKTIESDKTLQESVRRYQNGFMKKLSDLDVKMKKTKEAKGENSLEYKKLKDERDGMVKTMYSCVGLSALYRKGQSLKADIESEGGNVRNLNYRFDKKINGIISDNKIDIDGKSGDYNIEIEGRSDFEKVNLIVSELEERVEQKEKDILTLKMKKKKGEEVTLGDVGEVVLDKVDVAKELHELQTELANFEELRLVMQQKEEYFRMIKSFIADGAYTGDLKVKKYSAMVTHKNPKKLDDYLKKHGINWINKIDKDKKGGKAAPAERKIHS